LKSALEFDESLQFGEVYHEYRILNEIPDKLPCFRRQLDWWAELKQKFFSYFVDNLYINKATKVFPQMFIGYDAAAKRSAWG
jgi:hypothetical protein